MENIIRTELLYVAFSVFLVDYIIIIWTRSLINKVKQIEKIKIRKAVCTFLIALWLCCVVLFSKKLVVLVTAYIEYKTNTIEEVIGIVEGRDMDNHRVFVTIDKREYILFKKMNEKVNEISIGDEIRITAGRYSNYVFELE